MHRADIHVNDLDLLWMKTPLGSLHGSDGRRTCLRATFHKILTFHFSTWHHHKIYTITLFYEAVQSLRQFSRLGMRQRSWRYIRSTISWRLVGRKVASTSNIGQDLQLTTGSSDSSMPLVRNHLNLKTFSQSRIQLPLSMHSLMHSQWSANA